MFRRVLLVILDGWGVAPATKGNAVSLAKTPNFDFFWSKYPHTLLSASGEEVGLPKGQMGNSEVGHLNIGGGRVVWQDLPRITKSIRDGSFFENRELKKAFSHAKEGEKPLHLIGLLGPGGVHSHQIHLYALLEMAKREKVHNVFVHVITDGRDTSPRSALKYLNELEDKMKEIGVGKIATICGRYYAMDRDKRWQRVEMAYNAMTQGIGETASKAALAVEKSYKRGVSDEFIKPIIVRKDGIIQDDETVIFFNFRSDRPREICQAFLLPEFKGFKRQKVIKNLYFLTMCEYEKDLPVTAVAFSPEIVKNNLAEVISDEGLSQFHIAETEKYAHVTFFFNGGTEKAFEGEERLMIQSPLVTTYDLKPEMSAPEITRELIKKIGKFDFIVVNFANPDMVGHTGDVEATVKAVETVDNSLGQVVEKAKEENYDVIVIADHGNAEKMVNNDGTPCTAHTNSPVPFIYIGSEAILRKLDNPKLANVAPTILSIMGVPKPNEMKEGSLLATVREVQNV